MEIYEIGAIHNVNVSNSKALVAVLSGGNR